MLFGRSLFSFLAIVGLMFLCGCTSSPSSHNRPAQTDQPTHSRKAVRTGDLNALYVAALEGNAEEVQEFLDAGMGVNTTFSGHGPLVSVVVSGCGWDMKKGEAQYEARLKTVKLLTSRNADLTYADGLNNALLHDASLHCTGPVVKNLVAAGAPFRGRNKQGYSPLDMALLSSNWDAVRIFVDAGARTTAKQIAEIFFEMPEDKKLVSLIRQATEAPRKEKRKGK